MIHARQIEAFRAVMQTGAMTAAARIIHVTQPAVSRMIRDLETELGFALFDRRGNLVSPTAHARALLVEVERSFVGLVRIQAFAEDLRTGRRASVRVAALPAVAAGFLPRFVAKFSRQRPELRIEMDGLPSSVIRDTVVAGQFDIGITNFPFHNDALTITSLGDRAVVVMKSDHRLAKLGLVRAADLGDEPLILLSRFVRRESPVDVFLRSVTRISSIETPLATMACVLVAEGLGIAIVDPFSASEFVDRGLSLRPFEAPWVLGTAIVHSRERTLSVAAAEFRRMFLEDTARFLGGFNAS